MHNSKLTPVARELRKNMTPAERHLWYDYLRKYPIRFLRQKVIDYYIADFYCHKAKLVIEVDGAGHFEENAVEYDKRRTEHLNMKGIKVIRFTNFEVMNGFDWVCNYIDKEVCIRLEHF